MNKKEKILKAEKKLKSLQELINAESANLINSIYLINHYMKSEFKADKKLLKLKGKKL